ncbi:lamin tail domain-containing protein [Chryseobacterium angstadtii]|uniref:lamin tail domain-containing protein n=1 Tax=Chryseobacterium angstadtii TaxID=558151 RepID=UPI0012FEC8AC|nr:lamin tail domain-containing protein [Chryseobacterium angstadtii]
MKTNISLLLSFVSFLLIACKTDDVMMEDAIVSDPLIINEVLYDPSNVALEGDANGDGKYSQEQDEFIEFFNTTTTALDVSGYKIFDATGLTNNIPVHVFPAGSIIQPRKALVVFGGGTPSGTFGGAVVQTSTTGNLSLNNEVDFITVTDAAGTTVATFDIGPLSNNPNEAFTRNPDITGSFVQHSSVSSSLFSPGKKNNNSNF